MTKRQFKTVLVEREKVDFSIIAAVIADTIRKRGLKHGKSKIDKAG